MRRTSINSLFLSLISLLILFSCTSGSIQNPSSDEPVVSKAAPPGTAVNDILIADCLLPGQTIATGQYQTWQSSPRPARIPAWECKLQGGQYALNGDPLSIWRDSANQGDKVAQNYVGEIYRDGVGVPVNYSSAADWFRKSADQGYGRAQNNLGFLYEKGLGVPKNPQMAMKYYREANGLVESIEVNQAFI